MTKDSLVRSENKRVQVQHLDSSAGILREFPLAPKPRKKKFISKEERDEIIKKPSGSVAPTHDDRPTYPKGENNLGFFEVKREVLAKKQELLNQSIITNCAASNSRRILNDSIAKGLKPTYEVNPDPLHKSDPLRRYVDKYITQGATNNSINTSSDSSVQIQAIKTPSKIDERKPEKKQLRISLENDKSKNERIRHDKRPSTAPPNNTDTEQGKTHSPKSKQSKHRKVHSPKSKNNKRNRYHDDSLNNSRRSSRDISPVKSKSKSKDFENKQMQTWVYDILCCQNYYSVGLYLILLALVIGLIFVAFKLYVSFVLPKEKDTHGSNEINQPNWDKSPNIISDIIPDYDKLIHQVQAGLHSDYNVQKNLSNLELPIPKSHIPTRKHIPTTTKKISKTSAKSTRKKTTSKSTTTTTAKEVVKSYKKNLVPTAPKTLSSLLTTENTVKDNLKTQPLVNSNYRSNNFNYYNHPEALYSPVLTTQKPNLVTYPYNRWVGPPAETTSSSHWKWNGWKWVWQRDNQQYGSNLFSGVLSTPSSLNVRDRKDDIPINYDNSFSNSYSPTAKNQQTTNAYQKWWRNYYSSPYTQKAAINLPFDYTTKRYSVQNQNLYNSYYNRYQTTKSPTNNHAAINPYYNPYYTTKSSYRNAKLYNPYYNMYQTTTKAINQKDVFVLSNYQNQLESNLGNYIKKLRDGVDGENSGLYSGDDPKIPMYKKLYSSSDMRRKMLPQKKKKKKHKKHKKKKKMKNKSKTTTPKTTTTQTTTTLTTTPMTTTTTPTTTPTITTTTPTTTTTKASTMQQKTTHKKMSTARWTTYHKKTNSAFSTHDYNEQVGDKQHKYGSPSQNGNSYSAYRYPNELDENKNFGNKYNNYDKHFRNKYDNDNEFPSSRDKVHLADDHGRFDSAFNDIVDSFDSTFKKKDDDDYDSHEAERHKSNTKYHHHHRDNDEDDGDVENKPAESEDKNDDDNGDFMTKNKKYSVYTKKRKSLKHEFKNIEDSDENSEGNNNKEEYIPQKRSSHKRNRHTYLETIKSLRRKSRTPKEKARTARQYRRVKLLASIQHRIQAIKERERKKKLRKIKREEFLENIGRKRSRIMHVKKKCIRVKQFRPGTHIRIKGGPEKRRGKIIYSIRACRKLLIDDDVRVKCKDIEYKISGGKLTIKGERKGRLKRYTIYACKKVPSEDNDEGSSNEGGDEAGDLLIYSIEPFF